MLMLAYAFPPENLPGAIRPSRFFRYLSQFGFQTRVITASAQPRPSPDIQYLPNRAELASRRSIIGILDRVIRKLIRPDDPYFGWAFEAARLACVLHQQEPFQAVFSTSPPILSHLAALLIQRRLRLPWIADFRDPLLDNPFLSQMSVHRLVDKWIERTIFRHADILVSVSDVVADHWRLRYMNQSSKVRVIWNGYDPAELIKPLPLPPREHRVLAHIGTLYGGRTPLCVLESLRRLALVGTVDPAHLRLKFVGDFEGEAWTASERVLNEIGKIFRVECKNRRVPRAEALREMAEADFLLLADNNTANIGYTVPAKLFEYLQVGRPILAITSAESPVDRILRQSGVPYASIQPDLEPAEIDRRVLSLLRLPSMPVQPNLWFQETFNGRKQTEYLAGLLHSILQPANGERDE
jgi:glycosyltransferase involved in cell wall biosynthesis